MNWDMIKAYFPNPERTIEYYQFVEAMRGKVTSIKNVSWNEINTRAFTRDVVKTFTEFYHGSAPSANEVEE